MNKILKYGLIILLIFAFRTAVIEVYSVPSGSMIPSIMIGDKFIVNKLAYGIKIPFTEWKNSKYLVRYNLPERGEVIVFKHKSGENFVKRIVGLPGDSIEIKGSDVYVNGDKLERSLIDERTSQKMSSYLDDEFKTKDLVYFLEKSTNSYFVAKSNLVNDRQDFEKIIVPEGKYFVMGDNRDFSNDSRFWGFVPFDQIKGRASYVLISFVLNFSNPEFSLKLGRIGSSFTQ